MEALKPMRNFNDVKKRLEEDGYEYVGAVDICDCQTYFFVKPVSEHMYDVAIVDGWLGDYTPRIRKWNKTAVEALKKRAAI